MPHLSWDDINALPDQNPLYIFLEDPETLNWYPQLVFFSMVGAGRKILASSSPNGRLKVYLVKSYQVFDSPVPHISFDQASAISNDVVVWLDVYKYQQANGHFAHTADLASNHSFRSGQTPYQDDGQAHFLLASSDPLSVYLSPSDTAFLHNILAHYCALHWAYKGPLTREGMLQFLKEAEKYCMLHTNQQHPISKDCLCLIPRQPMSFPTWSRKGRKLLHDDIDLSIDSIDGYGGQVQDEDQDEDYDDDHYGYGVVPRHHCHVYPLGWMPGLLFAAFREMFYKMLSNFFIHKQLDYPLE